MLLGASRRFPDIDDLPGKLVPNREVHNEEKRNVFLAYLIIVMKDVAGAVQESLAILRRLNPNQVPAPKTPEGGTPSAPGAAPS